MIDTHDRVIAGTGAVASVGGNVIEVFEALCAGKSGLAGLRRFETTQYRTHNAYPMANHAPDHADNSTQWLCAAIAEAAGQAGLGENLRGVPVIVGSGLRNLRAVEIAWQAGKETFTPDLDFGPALRERFGCTDIHTLSNACAASLHALALGDDMLTLGDAETVVVAGVDTITESMFASLDLVQLELDALRPFDSRRKGVLMGDGAAAVVLRRGGSGRAVLRGVGITCDAHHVTAPEPTGVAAAISDAHSRAGVSVDAIDLVLAHGTGTVLNDAAEAIAMTATFGDARPLVTAIKSMTGHTSGGSGLLSLVVAVESLRTGAVPPILGLVEPIEESANLRLAIDGAIDQKFSIAQINAFGFGGVNSVAIVEAIR